MLSGAHPNLIETLHGGSPVSFPEAAPPTEGSQTVAAPEWMFDEELFFGCRERVQLTMGQKRRNKMQHAEGLVCEKHSKHTLDITGILQCCDETLECVCKAADKHPAKEGQCWPVKSSQHPFCSFFST